MDSAVKLEPMAQDDPVDLALVGYKSSLASRNDEDHARALYSDAQPHGLEDMSSQHPMYVVDGQPIIKSVSDCLTTQELRFFPAY